MKRTIVSRVWLLLTCGIFALVLYPLSAGPALMIAARVGGQDSVGLIYRPIITLAFSDTTIGRWTDLYLGYWGFHLIHDQ